MILGAGPPVGTVALVLAQQQPGNGDNGGQGEDFGKSSPVGLLVLILFLIAVALLVRSMTKHLKRVPASFDKAETDKTETDRADDGTADDEVKPAAKSEAKDAHPVPERGSGEA